ncbi:hypothetical protein RRG08_028139 [Elysia crispata]|uniref:Uncharacterized protein n=1 Tax=Elysia crispata TaxID=231223 RepID=A0AAE1D6G8_9GAST|nr:hypothetical protein RRG08_028139 [Elysia crispata]
MLRGASYHEFETHAVGRLVQALQCLTGFYVRHPGIRSLESVEPYLNKSISGAGDIRSASDDNQKVCVRVFNILLNSHLVSELVTCAGVELCESKSWEQHV